MIVRVRFFTRLREITGTGEESLQLESGATVRTALEALSARHGEAYREYVFAQEPAGFQLQFLVNGRSIAQMEGFETKLRDGDTLAIVPPVGGGHNCTRLKSGPQAVRRSIVSGREPVQFCGLTIASFSKRAGRNWLEYRSETRLQG
ncbi:MAG: ubiquitin-like small modifier protein 1 [Candidatus Bathyarchaeia archaeon]